MKTQPTILDEALRENGRLIQNSFKKEWTEADFRKADRRITAHFKKHLFAFQPTHAAKKEQFIVRKFADIDNILGLAYTSSSAYAALWVCNSGYLWATDQHRFIGFAMTEAGDIYGIADDDNENSIYIKM